MAGREEYLRPEGRLSAARRRLAGWSWPRPSTPAGSYLLPLAAGSVALLTLLVPAYLLLRTAGAETDAVQMLSGAGTWSILSNTLGMALAVTLASIAIALPGAWLTVSTDLPGRRLWTILLALPLVLPSYVTAYIYLTLLAPKGLLQQALEPLFGLERFPSFIGFPGAFLTLTLAAYPFVFLPVRAALQRLDPSLLEAARSLGLGPQQAARCVVLPHLRPALASGGLLVALYVLRDFGAVTMWQYSTFTRVIYNRYLSYRLDVAAALALVLVLLTVLLVLSESRVRGRARYGRLSAGAARQARPLALGRWRWPALLFLGGVVFVSLVLPALTLAVWLGRGLSAGADFTAVAAWLSLLKPAWNSLSVLPDGCAGQRRRAAGGRTRRAPL